MINPFLTKHVNKLEEGNVVSYDAGIALGSSTEELTGWHYAGDIGWVYGPYEDITESLIPFDSNAKDKSEESVYEYDEHTMEFMYNDGAGGYIALAGIDNEDNIIFLDTNWNLVKFDKDLNHIWTSSDYVSYTDDYLNLIIDHNNDIIVSTWNNYTSRYDGSETIEFDGYTLTTDDYICLIKFDSNGNFLWENYIVGRIDDSDAYYWCQNLGSISVDSNNNVYGTGYYQDTNLYKFDSNGNYQWGYESWIYPATETSRRWAFYLVKVNSNDEICVFGDEYELTEEGYQIPKTAAFWKFNTSGNLIDVKYDIIGVDTLKNNRNEMYSSAVIDKNDNIYFPHNHDLYKFDSNGNLIDRTYGDYNYRKHIFLRGEEIWYVENITYHIRIFDLDLNELFFTGDHESEGYWDSSDAYGVFLFNDYSGGTWGSGGGELTGTTFESTCTEILTDCMYSEEEWNGGIINFENIEEKSSFWDDKHLFDSIKENLTDIETNTNDANDYSLHVHNNHLHYDKHMVDSVTTDENGNIFFGGSTDESINLSEWLNQEDLDGDEEIYGGELIEDGEIKYPILENLKEHPLWRKIPNIPKCINTSCNEDE